MPRHGRHVGNIRTTDIDSPELGGHEISTCDPIGGDVDASHRPVPRVGVGGRGLPDDTTHDDTPRGCVERRPRRRRRSPRPDKRGVTLNDTLSDMTRRRVVFLEVTPLPPDDTHRLYLASLPVPILILYNLARVSVQPTTYKRRREARRVSMRFTPFSFGTIGELRIATSASGRRTTRAICHVRHCICVDSADYPQTTTRDESQARSVGTLTPTGEAPNTHKRRRDTYSPKHHPNECKRLADCMQSNGRNIHPSATTCDLWGYQS